MDAEPLIESAVARVTQAVGRFGKSRLAAQAEISESSIRHADREGWNPTREVLRKLEIAASQLEAEHAAEAGAAHRESGTENPATPVTV